MGDRPTYSPTGGSIIEETDELQRATDKTIDDTLGGRGVAPFAELCDCDTPLPPDGREGERLGFASTGAMSEEEAIFDLDGTVGEGAPPEIDDAGGLADSAVAAAVEEIDDLLGL